MYKSESSPRIHVEAASTSLYICLKISYVLKSQDKHNASIQYVRFELPQIEIENSKKNLSI